MKTSINPAQAQEALECIEQLKIKGGASKAAYALAKNTLALNRVLKDFQATCAAIRSELGVAPGERLDPSSDKAAQYAAKTSPLTAVPVEVELHMVELSEVLAVWADAPLTALTGMSVFIVDTAEQST